MIFERRKGPSELYATDETRVLDAAKRYSAEIMMPFGKLPEAITDAAQGVADRDRRIVKMLCARRALAEQRPENGVCVEETQALEMRKPSVIH